MDEARCRDLFSAARVLQPQEIVTRRLAFSVPPVLPRGTKLSFIGLTGTFGPIILSQFSEAALTVR